MVPVVVLAVVRRALKAVMVMALVQASPLGSQAEAVAWEAALLEEEGRHRQARPVVMVMLRRLSRQVPGSRLKGKRRKR